MCNVSIIIPVYKEGQNIAPLLERICESMKGYQYEVIIVDDNSEDETSDICQNYSKKMPVQCLIRYENRDLSSAVIHGFNHARGKYLICMDGDLSHQPEAIPTLLDLLGQGQQMVFGSRFKDGSEISSNFKWYRKGLSHIATLFIQPLVRLSDPLSGFFAIQRQTYLQTRSNIKTRGFKIGLEILVRSTNNSYIETPIIFDKRHKGQSKLNLKIHIQFIEQLIKLYCFKMKNLFSLAPKFNQSTLHNIK